MTELPIQSDLPEISLSSHIQDSRELTTQLNLTFLSSPDGATWLRTFQRALGTEVMQFGFGEVNVPGYQVLTIQDVQAGSAIAQERIETGVRLTANPSSRWQLTKPVFVDATGKAVDKPKKWLQDEGYDQVFAQLQADENTGTYQKKLAELRAEMQRQVSEHYRRVTVVKEVLGDVFEAYQVDPVDYVELGEIVLKTSENKRPKEIRLRVAPNNIGIRYKQYKNFMWVSPPIQTGNIEIPPPVCWEFSEGNDTALLSALSAGVRALQERVMSR